MKVGWHQWRNSFPLQFESNLTDHLSQQVWWSWSAQLGRWPVCLYNSHLKREVTWEHEYLYNCLISQKQLSKPINQYITKNYLPKQDVLTYWVSGCDSFLSYDYDMNLFIFKWWIINVIIFHICWKSEFFSSSSILF